MPDRGTTRSAAAAVDGYVDGCLVGRVYAVHHVVGLLGRRRRRRRSGHGGGGGGERGQRVLEQSAADGPPVRRVVLRAGAVHVVGTGCCVRVRVHRLGDDLVRGALRLGVAAVAAERRQRGQQQRHERRHQRLAGQHRDGLHAQRQQRGAGHPSGQQHGMRVLLLLAPRTCPTQNARAYRHRQVFVTLSQSLSSTTDSVQKLVSTPPRHFLRSTSKN